MLAAAKYDPVSVYTSCAISDSVFSGCSSTASIIIKIMIIHYFDSNQPQQSIMLYKITHDQSTHHLKKTAVAVCSRNVAIYITRDYIVRQTIKLRFMIIHVIKNSACGSRATLFIVLPQLFDLTSPKFRTFNFET